MTATVTINVIPSHRSDWGRADCDQNFHRKQPAVNSVVIRSKIRPGDVGESLNVRANIMSAVPPVSQVAASVADVHRLPIRRSVKAIRGKTR